jgi:phosphoglycolate phosphatase
MNSEKAVTLAGVLFDKDGTLFDFYRTWSGATESAALLAAGGDRVRAAYVMERSGRDPTTGRYAPGSVIASGSNRQIVECWAELLSHPDVESLYKQVSELFLAHQDMAGVPVLDLAPLFSNLRARGFRLGVATMDSEESARRAMARHGVAEHLDFICGYDTGHGIKPGPGMVTAFARLVGHAAGAKAVVVVGDSPHDIHMARAAGAGRAIGVLTGVSPREALLEAGADDVIASIAELEALL